eukprot:scaffold1900_cov389-Prasinococcus_capsulatus_cf.AAC.31
MLSPTMDMLPDRKKWSPNDAILTWTHDDQGLHVQGFGRKLPLPCTAYSKAADRANPQAVETREELSRYDHTASWTLRELIFGRKMPRCPPSGANPSHLCKSRIDTEDDVLHVQNKQLPLFDGHLRVDESELLLQILTAPFLRIPLVIHFFASKERIKALASQKLQQVLDACLFEMGPWLKPSDGNPMTAVVGAAEVDASSQLMIPAQDRMHTSTPLGLLFNELRNAPHTLVDAVDSILRYALALDSGRYDSESGGCAVILYAVRLAIRIESFLAFILEHCEWRSTAGSDVFQMNTTSVGSNTHIRGLADLSTASMDGVSNAQNRIHKQLHGTVFRVLERWYDDCAKRRMIRDACVIRAHITYLFKDLKYEHIDERIAVSMLSSQLFLNANHGFAIEALAQEGRGKSSKKEERTSPLETLGIPDLEVFDIFQRHRHKLVKWLSANVSSRNNVMESVVRLVTFTGSRADRDLKAGEHSFGVREWKNADIYGGGEGRFVPDTDVAESDPEEDLFLNTQWTVSMDAESAADVHDESFEDFLRRVTTSAVGMEINCQLGVFSVKQNEVHRLKEGIMSVPEFRNVFGQVDAGGMECAEVQDTSNRSWYRLVGRRHDLQLWTADPRSPTWPPSLSRALHGQGGHYSGLSGNEYWIRRALACCEDQLKAYGLYLTKDDCSMAHMVCLLGVHLDSADKKQTASGDEPKGSLPELSASSVLREVVLFKDPPTAHIYEIESYGRHRYRSLIYTSNFALSYHALPRAKDEKGNSRALAAGNIQGRRRGGQSLVIARYLSKAAGQQRYIPQRFLAGLLPDALVKKYQFWQQMSDSSISGYLIKRGSSESTGAVEDGTVLKIEISDDLLRNTRRGWIDSKWAKVVRYCAQTVGEANLEHAQHAPLSPKAAEQGIPEEGSAQVGCFALPDYQSESYMLLNLQTATHGSLATIRQLFIRMESLSHILVWSRNSPAGDQGSALGLGGEDPLSIDLVELPRLQLRFSAKEDAPFPLETLGSMDDPKTGLGKQVHLYSEDYPGLFISNLRDRALLHLLSGIPRSLLLQNSEGQLFVLVAANSLPSQPEISSSEYAVPEATSVLFNHDAISAIEATHYVYPVHVSGAFLLTQSLASSLYLLLLRVLYLQYDKAFEVVESSTSDKPLNRCEQQWFYSLVTTLQNHSHPDAWSLRLKLSWCTLGNDMMKCPWQIHEQLQGYVHRRSLVSAECRLPIQEELALLSYVREEVNGSGLALELTNYLNCIAAVHHQSTREEGKDDKIREDLIQGWQNAEDEEESFKAAITLPKALEETFPPLDSRHIDRICADLPAVNAAAGKMLSFQVSYSRPGPEATKAQGEALLGLLEKIMTRSKDVRGKDDSLGFCFMYECLTQSIEPKLIDSDGHPFNVGALLVYMVPAAQRAANTECRVLHSVLSVMVHNRAIAGEFPKYEKSGVMGRVKTLVRNCCKQISTKGMTLSWGSEAEPYRPLLSVTADMLVKGELFATISALPTDCSSRSIGPFQHVSADVQLGLTDQDVSDLSEKPLTPLGLERFVHMEHVQPARGDSVGVPSDVPGSAKKHSFATLEIAAAMMDRLSADVAAFAAEQRQRAEPTVDINKLDELKRALLRLIQKDAQYMRTARAELWRLSNDNAPADVSQGSWGDRGGSADEKLMSTLLLNHHYLMRMSGKRATLSISLLMGVLMSPQNRQFLKGLNPILGPKELEVIEMLSIAFALKVSRLMQSIRAYLQLQKLEETVQQLRLSAVAAVRNTTSAC